MLALLLRKNKINLSIIIYILYKIRYNKNVLFNEPTPNVYYKFGDEIGKKEVKYNST